MKIKANSRLLFIGDSVTDVERARPIGQGLFNALGVGYVSEVNKLLFACYPELHIHVMNVGTSGNNVRDLKARWQTDVIDLKPDYLSINIGINDIWRQFDCPGQKESHVGIEEYEATLIELIEQTLPLLSGGLILITPHFMEPNREDAMRKMIDEYGNVVKKLAKKYNATLVDTQAAFDKIWQYYHPARIAWDRIHPNAEGHAVMAKAFLDAIGFEWK